MVDQLWDVYAGAIIECEIDGELRCLRGPDAPVLPAPAPIFVLTAYNPGGKDREAARNEESERDLERDLGADGVPSWPAVGRARDGSWSEPGVAIVGVDRARACAYGARYGQLAVYELNDAEVLVVRCADAGIVRAATRRK
jgi:Protein of unknown function (DUF3293)